MKKIKSEKLDSLIELLLELFEKKQLKKAIFSKPDSSDEIKSVLTPKSISGANVLQLEVFSRDNKAYHLNFKENFLSELEGVFYSHAQINIISTIGDAQFMRAKSGKETLIGYDKIRKSLCSDNNTKLTYGGNNNEKKYILSGSEDFLKKLGISDENGRIRDKMQAKFRQINKFLEHIKSIEAHIPSDKINVYDLCCGKSYLSFAVYHYFKNIKKMDISMKCVDLKADVIEYCASVGARLGFDGMEFICANIDDYEMAQPVDLVISLHACDIATDIVLNKGSSNGASVILSTPCCHHELNSKINCSALSFITRHSMLRQKLCDSATDALRLLKLESEGYEVQAMELIDPEDTPKNIILKAIKKDKFDPKRAEQLRAEYCAIKKFLLGEE